MSKIIIKRSGATGSPPSLGQGELAYSFLSGTLSNGGDRLYIGTGTETEGSAANIEVIGGKYFTEKLDHTPGVLTSNSAIVTDSSNKIDILNVDDLTFNGRTISSSDINGNIIIDPNGTGVVQIVGPATFSNTVSITGDITFGSISSSRLTQGRVVVAGLDGELIDYDSLRYNSSLFTISTNTSITGTLSVSSDVTLATAKIEDLDSGKLVKTTTGGRLETLDPGDALNFDNDVSFLRDIEVTGNTELAQLSVSGNTVVTGALTSGNVKINTDTITTTTGNLVLNPASLIDVSSKRIINLANPISSNDAVNLAYLQNNYTSVLSFRGDVGTDTLSLKTDVIDISGNAGITTTVTNNQLDISLNDTAVTPGQYGSNNQAVSVTVDQKGRITDISEISIGTNLSIEGDSGSDTISLNNDTLSFTGGTGVSTNVTDNEITLSIGQDVSTTSNVVFAGGQFTGNLTVNGNLNITGNTTTIGVQSLSVEDSLFYLSSNNSTDVVDIGFMAQYDGSNYTGLFRDATNANWYLFGEYSPADTESNIIDINDVSFSLADLNVNSINFAQSSISLSGDVVGTVNISKFDGNNVNIITQIQPNSVVLGTDTSGNYVQSVSVTSNTGLAVSGTGESATVNLSGVIANTNGTIGVATYDSTNFSITSSLVTIKEIDGGTY